MEHMVEALLSVQDMTKKYGNFLALDKFTCEFPPGVTGLLGPNGAGKTTFIRCLLGVLPFESGSIRLQQWRLPHDLFKIKDLMGYQPDVDTRMLHTTAMQFVTHFGRMAGLPRQTALQRTFDVLYYVGLAEARYRDMNTFSFGMLQRVKLATALVQDPLLLILDEPTAGMDRMGRDHMLELIKDLGNNYGKHILMSTHLLPDVERTCSSVVVIDHGKQIMQGDLSTLLERKGSKIPLIIRVSNQPVQFAKTLENAGFDVVEVHDDIKITIDKENEDIYLSIFKLAKENNVDIRMLSPYRLTLEDVFLDIVGYQNQNFMEKPVIK